MACHQASCLISDYLIRRIKEMDVNDVGISTEDVRNSLSRFFGFENFKLNQEDVILSILEGKVAFGAVARHEFHQSEDDERHND